METATTTDKNRALENFHIVLWLIKDLCWCMLWKPLALFMILPTFLFAVYITYNGRQIKTDLYHNSAVLMWILANSTWMIGEFFFHDGLKPIAFAFFMLGLLIEGYFYLSKLIKKST